MAGAHTLAETERQVSERLEGIPLDFDAMAVVSNLFRAANATRNYLERTVLKEEELSWTAFVVLWVVWIWEPIETRLIAEEGGFSKATLTGVLQTLEGRGLLLRHKSAKDGRLVEVELTQTGRKLMKKLFPKFNLSERQISGVISVREQQALANKLRLITSFTEGER